MVRTAVDDYHVNQFGLSEFGTRHLIYQALLQKCALIAAHHPSNAETNGWAVVKLPVSRKEFGEDEDSSFMTLAAQGRLRSCGTLIFTKHKPKVYAGLIERLEAEESEPGIKEIPILNHRGKLSHVILALKLDSHAGEIPENPATDINYFNRHSDLESWFLSAQGFGLRRGQEIPINTISTSELLSQREIYRVVLEESRSIMNSLGAVDAEPILSWQSKNPRLFQDSQPETWDEFLRQTQFGYPPLINVRFPKNQQTSRSKVTLQFLSIEGRPIVISRRASSGRSHEWIYSIVEI